MRMFNRDHMKGAVIGILAVALVFAIGPSRIASAATTFAQNLFIIGGGNGNQIVPQFPTWSINEPLQPPVLATTATTTGGALGSNSTLYFRVAAITASGTTTASSEIATTTGPANTAIKLNFTPVANATGYVLYYGTTTPGSEIAYQATTTPSMVFTSTSTPSYALPQGFTTAFAAQLSGTASTSIDAYGPVRAQLSATTSACTASLNGDIFYSTANAHLWLCTGAGPTWTLIK